MRLFCEANINTHIPSIGGDVHIWLIHWQKIRDWLLDRWTLLLPEEQDSIRNYHFADDQMRHMAGIVISKTLMAEYAKVPIEKIRIERELYGKPFMVVMNRRSLIEYSVSYSEEIVALAFSKAERLGIDIERQQSIEEYLQIAKNFFAFEEYQKIKKSQSIKLFYDYWTAKEAYVKALGTGLQRELNCFCIRGNHVYEKNGLIKTCRVIHPNVLSDYAICIAIN